jgi:hypothetical protein
MPLILELVHVREGAAERGSGFPLNVEVLPKPIILSIAIREEYEKQKCSATEMFMLAVTITTQLGPLSMRGARQIIVEEEMEYPLIRRPVVHELNFVASLHLDSKRDKFHLHDFSHIGEDLLEMCKKPPCALFKASTQAHRHFRVD